PLAPRAVLVERARSVEQPEVVEQEQAAASEREMVGPAGEVAVVGGDRLRAATQERELLADALVDAREVGLRRSRTLEQVERADRIMAARRDRAGEHQQVRLGRQPLERGVDQRARTREVARRVARVGALVERDEMRRLMR